MSYTLGDRVYDALRSEILKNEYPANTMLSEAQLAKKYGVSKAPIKTALRRLCDEGYLISYPRKGYLVLNMSTTDYSAIQQLRYAMERISVIDLISYGTPESLSQLRQIAALEIPSDPRYTTVNAQFHMTMARLTENRFLVQYLDMIMAEESNVYTYLESKNMPLEEQDCHGPMLDAIEAHDSTLALQLLKKDIIDYRVTARYSGNLL